MVSQKDKECGLALYQMR